MPSGDAIPRSLVPGRLSQVAKPDGLADATVPPAPSLVVGAPVWQPSGVDEDSYPVPWSARAPQRYAFAAVAVVLGIAVVITALAYIRSGTGGIVPYLMITVGPVLAVIYVYYFGFRKFDDQQSEP